MSPSSSGGSSDASYTTMGLKTSQHVLIRREVLNRGRRSMAGGLARLWHAAGGLREAVWRDLARFLLAVPCRRGEAARWIGPTLILLRPNGGNPAR